MGGIYVRCVLNFLGNWQIIFQSSNSTFDSLQQCSRALGLILVGLSQFNLEDRWTPIMCSGLLININFLSLMTLGGQSWHITPIFIDHDTVIQLEKQYDLSKDSVHIWGEVDLRVEWVSEWKERDLGGQPSLWEGVTGASTLPCIKELSWGSQQKRPQPKRL